MPKPKYVTDWSQVPVVVDVGFVSRLLQLNPQKIKKHLNKVIIKGQKVGKTWFINKSDLSELLNIEED